MENQPRKILKINLPLSPDPLYVEVDDPDKSVNEILEKIIEELEKAERFHQAQQIRSILASNTIRIVDKIQEKKKTDEA